MTTPAGPGDDRWTISADPVTPARCRVWEAIMAVGNEQFGTRGLSEVSGGRSWPSVFAAGVYDSQVVPSLLPGPLWADIDLDPDDEWSESAELDLRHGTVTTRFTLDGSTTVVTTERFASATRPSTMGLRITGPLASIVPSGPLRAPPAADHRTIEATTCGSTSAITVCSSRGTIAAAATQAVVDDDERCLTRIAAYASARSAPDPPVSSVLADARAQLDRSTDVGFDRLRVEHRNEWADRWRLAGTDIEGDHRIELAVKLAEYHLMSWGDGSDDLAIGARSLTGPSYRGHVFWDTDVFVVPALAALSPGAARGALSYRCNRLRAARERACSEGHDGARFPWESASVGDEVTPREAVDLRGRTVPILTGELEEHIVADVAWSIMQYHTWTGDSEFLRACGADVLRETARYWASRAERDPDGSAHLRGVIGPDEYHERIDDNAFTNLLARYNLLAAADVCGRFHTATTAERNAWRELAERFEDGFDPATAIYEQFSGFHDLDPTLVASIGRPPLSADAILGHDRIQRTQVIKQPDVLMLFHMIPEALHPGTLEANLDFYLPRTASGSSLSPAICAGLLARAGRTNEAIELFELALRIDLDDLTGTTSGGIHIATMGGAWQALTSGFLGVRPLQDGLSIDPQLPADWGSVSHRFLFRGASVQLDVDGDRCEVRSERDVSVASCDEAVVGRRHRFRRSADGWMRT